MTPGAADILTRITTAALKLGLGYLLAGRTRDAEALAVQLEALGPARKSDVDSIEADARRRLRQDEPTQSSPVERPRIAPDFPGGPLGEGD